MNELMDRRQFLGGLAMGASAFAMSGLLPPGALAENQSERPPNFIVILIDDMGYGDLGCYGSKLHRTLRPFQTGASLV